MEKGSRENQSSQGLQELDIARKHKDLQLLASTLVLRFGKKSPQYGGQLVVGPVGIMEDGQKRSLTVLKKMDEQPDDTAESGGFIILEKRRKRSIQLHFIGNKPPLDLQKKEAIIEDMDTASRRLSSMEQVLANPSPLSFSSIEATFVEGLNPQPVSP